LHAVVAAVVEVLGKTLAHFDVEEALRLVGAARVLGFAVAKDLSKPTR
jgi:hypothetical protein